MITPWGEIVQVEKNANLVEIQQRFWKFYLSTTDHLTDRDNLDWKYLLERKP